MSSPSRWFSPVTNAHNHTVLFRLGGAVVATYGPVMGLALFFGFAQGAWYLGYSGGDAGWMARYSLLAVFPAVVIGCRLASLMLDLDELKSNPVRALLKPGFMLQGGIIGGATAMLIGAYRQGIDPLLLLDTAAFTMPLSEALGRLGCHVYGCCWGRPTRIFPGLRYTDRESKVLRCRPELHDVPLHAAPLYTSMVSLALLAAFAVMLEMPRNLGVFAGVYLCVHPILRFGLEHFRDDDRGRFGSLTHSKLYAILLFMAGCIVLFISHTRGIPAQINTAVSFWQVVRAQFWPLFGIAVAGFFVFGVHRGRVGTWLGNHDAADGNTECDAGCDAA